MLIESSSFVEAVESVVEAVDCCRLHHELLESSSFVEAVESVVEAVDCCNLLYLRELLVLLKLLNLLLLNLLIVVGFYML